MRDIGLPRELAPGIFWLADCLPVEHDGSIVHGYSSTYLVAGTDASLLVDTGHPKDWPSIQQQLDICHRTHGAPPVRYLVPTHAEVPHAGNLASLLDRYPEARAYGDVRDYHLFFPGYEDRFVEQQAGDEIDLGTTRFVFVDAVLKDLVTSLWGYATTQRCLFPGDGFAYVHHHQAGECGRSAEECPDLPLEQFTALFAEYALYWTRFTDMQGVIDRLDRMVTADYPVDLIAPGHGNPILDPAVTFPRIKAGLLLGAAAAAGD